MAYETDGINPNPYYSEIVSLFKEYHQRRKQLEANFTPDIMQEYTELMDEYTKMAAELLKLGVPKKLDTNAVVLILDNEEYDVSKKELINEMGKRQWEIIFPPERIEVQDMDNPEQEKGNVFHNSTGFNSNDENNGYRSYNYNAPPVAITNPLGALFAALLTPYFNPGIMGDGYGHPFGHQPPLPQSPPPANNIWERRRDENSDILADFSGLQKKIVLIERERDSAREAAAASERKFSEYKKSAGEQLEQLKKTNEAQLEAVNKASNEQLEQLKQSSDTQIEQLQREKEESFSANRLLNEKITQLEERHNVFKQQTAKEKEELAANFTKQADELNEQITKLKQEKESILSTTKKDKDSILSQLQSSREKETKLRDENIAVTRDFNNRISSIEAKAAEDAKKAAADLTAAVEKAKNEARSETASSIRAEANARIEDIKQDAEKRLSEAKTKIEQITRRADELAKKTDEFKNKLNTTYAERKDIDNKLIQVSKDKDRLTEQLRRAEEQAHKAEEQVKKLTEQVNKLQEKDVEKEDHYKKLEDECGTLRQLAYRDAKSDVMNVNAFNRDFAKCDKNNTVLVMVGIRNMKNINGMYGRDSGDVVISKVAAQLANTYGKDNTYRILGDQFIVLIKNGIQNNVISQMINMKQVLMSGNIEIVFGASAGNMAPDLKSFLAAAEDMMNQMKSGNPIGQGTPAPNQIYQMPTDNTGNSTPVNNTSIPEEIDMDSLIAEYMGTKN